MGNHGYHLGNGKIWDTMGYIPGTVISHIDMLHNPIGFVLVYPLVN